jgi:hypothetical protein
LRRIKLYLHIVVLPEGRILLELKARGGGGAAAASELVVDAVQMHRGYAGARGGLPAPGRGDGGGGGSEIRQNGVEMGFRFEMGSGGRERRDVGQFRIWSRPAQLELCESKTIATACGVGPISMPVDFECRYGARKKIKYE